MRQIKKRKTTVQSPIEASTEFPARGRLTRRLRALPGYSVVFLYTLIITSGCSEPQADLPTPALDHLLTKINERINIMETVARFKYSKKLPISDPVREAALLKNIEARADVLELSRDVAVDFFISQIEVAKQIQSNLFDQWNAEGLPTSEPVIDLFEARKRIDQLNSELLTALVAYRKHQSPRAKITQKAAELIHGPGVDDKVRQNSIRPLLE